MPDTKKGSSPISVLTICAIFIALLSFLLPYVSINFFGVHTISGIAFIVEAIEYEELPAMLVVICPVLSVAGLIFAFASMKSSKVSVGTIVSSGIGMIIMIVAMSGGDLDIIVALDYAGIGFYLYEVMSFAAVVLPAVSLYMSKGTTLGKDDPISTPKPNPAPKPSSLTKKICPKCKKEQDKDASFCRFCGTPLGESTAAPPAPKPDPKPAPKSAPKDDPIKNRKVICPHCGARHIEGTTKCKYCGTLFDGNESVSPKPGPVPHPNPAATPAPNPAPLKKDGKVICPHCGARQKEDTAKCKYCGTPIH